MRWAQMFTNFLSKNKMIQPHCAKLSSLRFSVIFAFITGVLLSLSGLTASAAPSSTDDLLPAEEAFKVSARFKNAKTIELNYQIADGYYMYRKRFRVNSETPQFKTGKIAAPPGLIKQDATFGRVETYRKSVRVLLPITKLGVKSEDKMIKVAIISQGCADVGVCYPPLRHDLTLQFGSGDIVKPASSAGASFAAPTASTPNVSKTPSIADMVKKAP
jgi:thioredoxin:protein disulfide reductase